MMRRSQFLRLLAAAVLGVVAALVLIRLFDRDKSETAVESVALPPSSTSPKRVGADWLSHPGNSRAGAGESPARKSVEGPEPVPVGGGTRAPDSDDGDDKPPGSALLTENNQGERGTPTSSRDDPQDEVERPAEWCFRAAVGSNRRFGPLFETRERHFFASDSGDVWNGSRAVTLGTNGFGINTDVMWQAVDAAPYRGSRVKVSARVRSTGYGAYLFLGFRDVLSNDVALANKQQHLLIQNNQVPVAWTPFEVDLDVPSDAVLIYYGAAIYNGGQLWVDDLYVEGGERIEQSVPTQPSNSSPVIVPLDPSQFLAAPSNLDFEITNDAHKMDTHGC